MLDNDGRAVSYFAAVFDMEGEPIAALCNRVYPLVGLLPAATLSDPGGAFLHHAVLEHAFARWDEFHLLDADLLNAELRPEMLEALAPGELSQVRYWKPVRVGDVIYNSWD